MAVTTININDILTTKAEGEVVTAAEWNKLITLFYAINGNANELLSVKQQVDANRGNILNITAGAVPDESITSAKLSTISSVANTYIETTDVTPDSGKTYYTYADGTYTACSSLASFEDGVVYYELDTIEPGPAISSLDVIANKLITGDKIANSTLTSKHCVTTMLGELLNNCIIYDASALYANTAPPATAASTTYATNTLKLSKQHKAVILIGYGLDFAVLTANETAPNFIVKRTVSYHHSNIVYTSVLSSPFPLDDDNHQAISDLRLSTDGTEIIFTVANHYSKYEYTPDVFQTVIGL